MSRDYTEITDEQLRALNRRVVEQPSYEQLLVQNRVLREALQAVHHAWLTKPNNQEIDGFHFWYSAHIEQVEAAITATSQEGQG